MEPVSTHRFAPVTWNIDDSTVAVGHSCSWIRSVSINRIVTGKNDRPTVVETLSWEEEGVGVSVTLCGIMTVMFVNGDGV